MQNSLTVNLRLQVRSAPIAEARSPPAQGNLRITFVDIHDDARHSLEPYMIIVADAADAVSVNFSGQCKFLQI